MRDVALRCVGAPPATHKPHHSGRCNAVPPPATLPPHTHTRQRHPYPHPPPTPHTHPILCPSLQVTRHLALYHGVVPVHMPLAETSEAAVDGALRELVRRGHLAKGRLVAVVRSGRTPIWRKRHTHAIQARGVVGRGRAGGAPARGAEQGGGTAGEGAQGEARGGGLALPASAVWRRSGPARGGGLTLAAPRRGCARAAALTGAAGREASPGGRAG